MDIKRNDITMVDCSDIQADVNDTLVCFKTELQEVNYMTVDELFSGFNTIRAITFSYDLGFVNKIMSKFDYGEIVFGAQFMITKDFDMQSLMADVVNNAKVLSDDVKKYERLSTMLVDGDVIFKTPDRLIDHGKVYLLSADDGRTRVIKTSANMSRRAWNNDQAEQYTYDDTKYHYEEALKYFDTVWQNSVPVTPDVIFAEKSDDLVEGNVILKKAKTVNKLMVVNQVDDTILLDRVQYMIRVDKSKTKYNEVLGNIKPKDGMIALTPKYIEKVKTNIKKERQKRAIQINTVSEDYPILTFDWDTNEAKLNDKLLDLHPSDDEVKADIESIISMYNNFDKFVGDTAILKHTHFKLMNAIFSSPFHAKIRCMNKLKGIGGSAYPLFMLIASETSNCGKTFMIKAALKLMTGKTLDFAHANKCKTEDVNNAIASCKGIPFCVDEISNAWVARMKDIIIHPEWCEETQQDDRSVFIFASNNVLKPEEPIRKRMVFLELNNGLSSDVDKVVYENRGNQILAKLGTGFYREYLRRMMDKISIEIDFIMKTETFDETYYIDVLSMSSDVIMSIFSDYGYNIPSYIKKLTYNDDYSPSAGMYSAIYEIADLCRQHKDMYHVSGDNIIITLGSDSSSSKKLESWKNILPPELNAKLVSTPAHNKLTFNKKMFEKHLGHKISTFGIHNLFKHKKG